MSAKKFTLPKRYQHLDKNFWLKYYDLTAKYNPVDLGTGVSDLPPPQFVKEALLEAATSTNSTIHQYTRGAGHPRLVNALSKFYSHFIGRDIDPWTEIVATLGCYHALFLSVNGIVDEGDEVIIMEPFFDCFEQIVRMAGGTPRFATLKLRENLNSAPTSDDWILDFDFFESLFNEKTKVVILNTPHNPLGKIFTREELCRIANLCQKWDVVCISDEIYQFLVYDSKTHISMASLPGMWDRTITVASVGKLFGVTGWKLGWAFGPTHLIDNLQTLIFGSIRTANTFLQEATAICFEKELKILGTPESNLVSSQKEYEKKRDFLYKMLEEVGFGPVLPKSGYFITADWSPLEKFADLNDDEDQCKSFRFVKWLTKNVGVQAMPMSPYFSAGHKHISETFIRFCFVKSDAYLEKTRTILKKWRATLE